MSYMLSSHLSVLIPYKKQLSAFLSIPPLPFPNTSIAITPLRRDIAALVYLYEKKKKKKNPKRETRHEIRNLAS